MKLSRTATNYKHSILFYFKICCSITLHQLRKLRVSWGGNPSLTSWKGSQTPTTLTLAGGHTARRLISRPTISSSGRALFFRAKNRFNYVLLSTHHSHFSCLFHSVFSYPSWIPSCDDHILNLGTWDGKESPSCLMIDAFCHASMKNSSGWAENRQGSFWIVIGPRKFLSAQILGLFGPKGPWWQRDNSSRIAGQL